MVGTGTPWSKASWLVHLPVPFWPARSRITSTIGRPVSLSTMPSISVDISMR